jgi:hypothetical protein
MLIVTRVTRLIVCLMDVSAADIVDERQSEHRCRELELHRRSSTESGRAGADDDRRSGAP